MARSSRSRLTAYGKMRKTWRAAAGVGSAWGRGGTVLEWRFDLDAAVRAAHADLRPCPLATQHGVDHLRHVGMHGEAVHVADLDERCRTSAAPCAPARSSACRAGAPPRRDSVTALDAADQVGQRRVQQQVVERVAVRRADELHAALGDGARGQRLSSVPISSMTMTSGMWFSTASIITACCCVGRAAPACAARGRCPGCGMSPSPAISLRGVHDHDALVRARPPARAPPRAASSSCPRPGRPSSSMLRPTPPCRG